MATEKRLIDANAFADCLGLMMKTAYPNLFPGLFKAIDYVKDFPAVDAVEVVHGRLGPSYIDEYYGEWKDCLECGADNILPCNYCRNCGAKIDGGADNVI